jgi:FkbM family methyltransferase
METVVALSHALKALGQDFAHYKHEPEEPWMPQAITGSPVIVHAGASNGRHTFHLLKDFPGARVVAIEPASFNIRVLKMGIAMRGLGDKIRVIHAAASDQPGEMTLLTPRKTTGKRARAFAFLTENATDRPDFQGTGHFKETVKIIRLDDLGLDKVDFIRMDIEGAEFAALNGAKQLIDRNLPNFLIEIHHALLRERFGASAEQIADMFSDRGYRFFAVNEDGVMVERPGLELNKGRDFQDYYFIHPDRPLPEGDFKKLMATKPPRRKN